MKMLGKLARTSGCDRKDCSCNPAPSARPYYKRLAKRRERRTWKREASR